MSNNSSGGNDNFWPTNQQPPHHFPQHQQVLQPVPPPVPQMLAQHMQQHPHAYAVPAGPVVPSAVAGYYPNAAGMMDTFTANANGYPHHHGTQQQVGDEYADPYGRLIKVVYNSPPQPGAELMLCHQEDANQNLPGPSKQGYELFSNNSSFMLAAPGFGFTLHNPQQQQQPPASRPTLEQQQQHTFQQPLPLGLSASVASVTPTQSRAAAQAVASVPGVQSTGTQAVENGNNNTSELISQLVGNWAPTISGTYGNVPSIINEMPAIPPPNQKPDSQLEGKITASPNKVSLQKPAVNPVPPTISGTTSTPSSSLQPCAPNVCANRTNATVATSVAAVYNQQNDDNSAKLDQNVNKKQRIVAEVKPMRMSYSDVLSKNVSGGRGGGGGISVSVSTLTGNGNVSSTSVNADTTNAATGTLGNGTKSSSVNIANGSVSTATKSSGKKESKKANAASFDRKTGAASVASQKERGNEVISKNTERANGNTGGTGPASAISSDANGKFDTIGVKPGSEKGRKIDKLGIKKEKGTRSFIVDGSNEIAFGKARRARRSDETDINELQNGDDVVPLNDETEEERADDFDEDDSEEYDHDSVESEAGGQQSIRGTMNGQQQQANQFVYNVKKNSNGTNDTHIEKINLPRASAYRKGGTSGRSAGGSRSFGNQQQDRPFGTATSGGKRSGRSRKNQKYVFLEKLLLKWLEYTVLALRWLWSLVSDVVYLSLRLVWDYVLCGYQYCWQHARTLRQDFRKNSGRPRAWLRSVWQSFDNRFEKDSRWAFWRRCRRQKPTMESNEGKTGGNHYKDGRLPSTADEAMSSLLNCKGKDAYSILGVSPDCSQEQIRKHYKKIAVLVHPDKNKQPGAEEAFKVLQRSFELIGETESRKKYDQSLAESLNAEKAWSEINDLLTQLHTKISEAANTIRCSSCCLRHPRKPTGRAHYAARECSSCKIRHPAREGDIWAETTFLGFRWKYLAMMEGSVYDITEWANCQKGALSHLQPNSHIVQYRIVLGSSSQQQQQHQQQQQQHQQQGQQQEKEQIGRSRKEPAANEPNLDDFLNNIYAGQNQQTPSQNASSRRRYRRN